MTCLRADPVAKPCFRPNLGRPSQVKTVLVMETVAQTEWTSWAGKGGQVWQSWRVLQQIPRAFRMVPGGIRPWYAVRRGGPFGNLELEHWD